MLKASKAVHGASEMVSKTDKPRVLIAGAGIAGTVLAYWLHRANLEPIVVEKAKDMRSTGQAVELSTSAVREIVISMGLSMDVLKQYGTTEAGLAVMTDSGTELARFGVSTEGRSFTSELEILRGELSALLYDRAKDNVEFRFADSITNISQGEEEVTVTFESGKVESFACLVACDGLYSNTRKLAGFQDIEIRPLNQFTAFFTIENQIIGIEDKVARFYGFSGGRNVLVRPDRTGLNTRAYLSIMKDLSQYRKMSLKEQKALMRSNFEGIGYLSKKVLDGMDNSAEDFYMTEIAQVRAKSWSTGRVVLTGDAAYCPSPISGMGTDCAILGAYLLANELGKAHAEGKSVQSAFERYEALARPFIESAQKLPPGAPGLFNPQSTTGVVILRGLIFTFAKLYKVCKLLFFWVPSSVTNSLMNYLAGDDFKLPEYRF